MTDKAIYKELGSLTKDRDLWEESVPYLSSLLKKGSVRVQAKALWLLGEIGLAYPQSVQDHMLEISVFCNSSEPLLRERALNALGRIGRADLSLIEPYWADLFRFADDEEPKVRLAFIWASENIATNSPGIYEGHMQVFGKLLFDTDNKVRMEAPEFFRVLGKRRPDLVRPFVEQLHNISVSDSNRVVRVHCLGAIKAAGTADPVIRRMTPSDLEALYELLSDPQVMRYLEPPYSREQTERFLDRAGLADPPLIYAVEKDAVFIGYVIYHDYDDESIEIGWVLKPAYWGKGYASALTEQLIEKAEPTGKHLVIECSPEQEITKHIAIKYGFRDSGTSEGLSVFRK